MLTSWPSLSSSSPMYFHLFIFLMYIRTYCTFNNSGNYIQKTNSMCGGMRGRWIDTFSGWMLSVSHFIYDTAGGVPYRTESMYWLTPKALDNTRLKWRDSNVLLSHCVLSQIAQFTNNHTSLFSRIQVSVTILLSVHHLRSCWHTLVIPSVSSCLVACGSAEVQDCDLGA